MPNEKIWFSNGTWARFKMENQTDPEPTAPGGAGAPALGEEMGLGPHRDNMQSRAAGGLVWRDAPDKQVLIVHRPIYDDWTLPKGRLEDGEEDQDCALREVAEETGLVCELGDHLADVDYYSENLGCDKQVRYWAMRPISGEFIPCEEVDEVSWLGFDEANEILTYERDRYVVGILREHLRPEK